MQHISEHLWRRWQREYMPTLRQFRSAAKDKNPPAEGSLVLIAETNLKRGRWPLARVVRHIVGRDGRVRAAFVKIRGFVTRRAVKAMIQLEASERENTDPAAIPPDRANAAARPIKREEPIEGARARRPEERRRPRNAQEGAAPGEREEAQVSGRYGRPINLPARYKD
jgi:hypothetical protein